MYNPFEINTGDIFYHVYENWKSYDRAFLKKTFKDALETILYNQKMFTAEYDEKKRDYFKNRTEFVWPRDLEAAQDKNNFPFPDYFLKYKEDQDEYPSIVECLSPVTISKDSSYFDLFFGLKLSVTDIMNETEEFLQYHLESTFADNFDEYDLFLENLVLKYSDFLKEKYVPVVSRYINNKKKSMEDGNVKEIEKNTEFTLARQVLAINYMLEELRVSSVDKTEIARFIQFLTGKDAGAKNIKDSTIYKWVRRPLNKSDKALETDLIFIRNYFDKLGLSSISQKISKEIGSKE